MAKNRKCLLVDYRAKRQIKSLMQMGFDILQVYKHSNLQLPLSSHPDMLIYPLYNKVIYAPGTSYDTLNNIRLAGCDIVRGSTHLTCNYPGDIAYNVARIGNKVFHNTRYTDPLLHDELHGYGCKFIRINQGYTKCNICVIGNNAAITEDRGIARVLCREDVDVLLIPPGNVRLPGYEYGFIGGASGCVGDTIFLTGRILNDDIRECVERFIEKHKFNLKYLSEDEIIDIGSIIPLNQE